MKRYQIIQRIIDQLGAKSYLEVGVQSGDTFLHLKARNKIAVDPRFLIPWKAKLQWYRWNRCNIFNRYYEMSSDEFFLDYKKILMRRGVDVAFVDGLHTFKQSLADIKNSMNYLREGGVIVIDDCNPSSEGAANPVKAPEQVEWNGDVWKSVAYLRSLCPDLNVFTIDTVYGLGVVTRGTPENMLDYSLDQIADLTYADFDSNRNDILNLKDINYFNRFVESLPPLRSK